MDIYTHTLKTKRMENRFKEGQMVHSKKDPQVDLVIRRYVKRIYYCQIKGHEDAKEQVYFERELESNQ